MKKRGLTFPAIVIIVLILIALILASFFVVPLIKERSDKKDSSGLRMINDSQAQAGTTGSGGGNGNNGMSNGNGNISQNFTQNYAEPSQNISQNISQNVTENACSDGTSINSCSIIKPLYCNSDRELIPYCSECGCEEDFKGEINRKLDGSFFVWYPYSDISILESIFQEGLLTEQDTFIFNSLSVFDCPNNEFLLNQELYDDLPSIFSLADQYGISIYMGLVNSFSKCSGYYNEPYSSQTVSETGSLVSSLENLYNQHNSFKGYYIPDEIFLAQWTNPPLTYNHYQSIVNKIREHSNREILASVSLKGIYFPDSSISPSEMGSLSKDFIDNTGMDVLIFQDSVGTARSRLWDNSRPLLDYFSEINNAIGSNHFWVDVELFNVYNSDYESEGGTYFPTSLPRLIKQIDIADISGADKIVSWITQTHLSKIDYTALSPYSNRLLESYYGYYGISDFTYIVPKTYSWMTSFSESYPDSGNEMFNFIVANPANYQDSSWSGVYGDVSLSLDLGEIKSLRWLGIHSLSYSPVGISFPDSLSIECSLDSVLWNSLGELDTNIVAWDGPRVEGDGSTDFVIQNLEPLNANCRYLNLTLINSDWTFISEIEIVGQKFKEPDQLPTISPWTNIKGWFKNLFS